MADHSSDLDSPLDVVSTRRGTHPDARSAFAISAPPSQGDGAAQATEKPDEADIAGTSGASRKRRSHRVARTDWRLGGRTVRAWREWLLAAALITLAGVIAIAAALEALWASPIATVVATLVVWAGFIGVAVYALSRSRPVGLLRFRAVDLLFGLGFALMLRITQGWMEMGEHGVAQFPSLTLIAGAVSPRLWAIDIAGVALVAPVAEEFFFRAVVLVSVFNLMRRPFGAVAAGVVAVLASSGLFVLVHALSSAADLSSTLTLLLLGLVCGALVVLTGRIWAAVLVHMGFNVSFLMLQGIGTLLG